MENLDKYIIFKNITSLLISGLLENGMNFVKLNLRKRLLSVWLVELVLGD